MPPGSEKTISVSLYRAEEAAESICAQIRDSCVRVQVAGSIRRRKPMVHDIDIVVIPRFGIGQSNSLFEDVVERNELEAVVRELAHVGKVKIKKHGERVLCLSFLGVEVPVDLYIASEETWSTLLLIRTGSKEHNIFLCSRARQLGMQLKADGSGLHRNGNLIASDSESSIFSALGLTYVPPEGREVVSTGNWAY